MQASKTAGGSMVPRSKLHMPAVLLLAVWMIGPLALVLWFSIHHYSLLDMTGMRFNGLSNFRYMFADPSFWTAIWNTLVIVVSSLILTISLGTVVAIVLDKPFLGNGIARLLAIAPFFVMPPVAALIWKNLLFNPVYGLISWLLTVVGIPPVDWLTDFPLASIVAIVTWEWTPFAALILLTSLQSLNPDQIEAARLDGAHEINRIRYIMVPHLSRSMTIVALIETIYFLSLFTEILVTTSGGPGDASTTLPYLIFKAALLNFDIGQASAGGVVAIILANIVAIFLMRTIAKNVET